MKKKYISISYYSTIWVLKFKWRNLKSIGNLRTAVSMGSHRCGIAHLTEILWRTDRNRPHDQEKEADEAFLRQVKEVSSAHPRWPPESLTDINYTLNLF